MVSRIPQIYITSLKNTVTVDKIYPMPIVNINVHKNTYGKYKYQMLIVHFVPTAGSPDNKIIRKNGIKVNRKLIPANKHFASGKMYFGMYTLFINEKFPVIDVKQLFVASLK